MEEKHWLDVVQAVGSIVTPILVLLLTALGWRARTALERRIDLENKLRDDRVSIYNQILEPFIILLMTEAAWKTDSKNKKKIKLNMQLTKC